MAASLPNSQHMQHWHHLPALAMKDENTCMRNPNPAHHHSRNDNLTVKVAANVHDRTHARALELIQKAEATLRTYSRSSLPSQLNVKRRRGRKRRQRRPPKTSTFHFEQRRRREKQSAGYEADVEFDLEEDNTNDTTLNPGIFPSAESCRRKKKRYFCSHDESRVDSRGSSLLADHSIQPTNHECQQHLTSAQFSPNLYQNTIDNVSVHTAATMASTISASSPVPVRHLPFRVGTDPSSPFTISQTNLTMSQAIALSHHAHIIVDAKSPFIVKHVNAAFCRILNSYGISSDVLGVPLLKSSQGQHDGLYPIAAQQGSLQQIILEAKKINLFPIVSEHGRSSQGWKFHAATNVRHDFGRGTGRTNKGVAGGIISNFLIQVVDESFESNFMQVIA